MEKDYDFYMKANLNKYIGEWIAICDQQIVSHGKSVAKVYDEAAKRCPKKRPLFARVPDKSAMIF